MWKVPVGTAVFGGCRATSYTVATTMTAITTVATTAIANLRRGRLALLRRCIASGESKNVSGSMPSPEEEPELSLIDNMGKSTGLL